MNHSVSFPVTVCLGGGDGGDVEVTLSVSEQEYRILREHGGDPEADGLEGLMSRILEEAQSEAGFLMNEYSPDEEFDPENADYIVRESKDF